jgi:prevent-host-death family protein
MANNMVMFKVNVFEVKAKLSEYLDRAAKGERIVICRHNKPVAELRPVTEAQTTPRMIGPIPGRPTFEVPPTFFEPLPDDELNHWEGMTKADPLSPEWPAVEGATPKVAERKSTYSRSRRVPRRRS